MDQGTGFQFNIGGAVGRGAGSDMGLAFKNTYRFVARGPVKGADGRWRRRCKWVEQVNNLVTTEGLNFNLSTLFKGSAYTAAWFVGLVNNASFSAIAATDTAGKITTSTPTGGTNGWEESTGYSESVRQTLTLGSVSAGSVDNTASKAVFTSNATQVINGGFVISNSTKGGTTGTLFGAASFGSTKSLSSGDTLSISVTLTAITV